MRENHYAFVTSVCFIASLFFRGAPVPSYNLAIVGFGNVARSFLRLLIAKETELRRRYDIRWRLTGIATRRNGWVVDPDGLKPAGRSQ